MTSDARATLLVMSDERDLGRQSLVDELAATLIDWGSARTQLVVVFRPDRRGPRERLTRRDRESICWLSGVVAPAWSPVLVPMRINYGHTIAYYPTSLRYLDGI